MKQERNAKFVVMLSFEVWLKIAVSELVIIKLIHKFVEDFHYRTTQ